MTSEWRVENLSQPECATTTLLLNMLMLLTQAFEHVLNANTRTAAFMSVILFLVKILLCSLFVMLVG